MMPIIDHAQDIAGEVRRRLEARIDRAMLSIQLRFEQVPLPSRIRGSVRKHTFVPWAKEVPVERLLLGTQGDLPGSQFATRTKDLMWTSRRVGDGPHAQLLRLAADKGASQLTDREILDSPYGMFAKRSLAESGDFFGVRDPQQIVAVARAFIGRYNGEPQANSFRHQSPDGATIGVARIRHSDHYQIIDGHHRAAAAAVAGVERLRVRTRCLPTVTAMQALVTRMSWIDGRRELYQPLPAPEFSSGWPTVRRCTDRLEKIKAFLQAEELLPPVTASYLDVASCYGWFVSAMSDLGYDSRGIELDPLARPLGEAAYGLPADRITIGDGVTILSAMSQRYDVVSCFSLLHHFILGKVDAPPEQLMEMLDKVTGRVLFLDSGQSHEAWFRKTMPDWTTEKLMAFLQDTTQFTRVVDLGPDADAVSPYEDNYGRHLFACIRD
jgi:hypothetical protein